MWRPGGHLQVRHGRGDDEIFQVDQGWGEILWKNKLQKLEGALGETEETEDTRAHLCV